MTFLFWPNTQGELGPENSDRINYRASVYSTAASAAYSTTSTYTPLNSSLLLAFIQGSGSGLPQPFQVTGHGLTWSRITSALTTSLGNCLSLWGAFAINATSDPLTVVWDRFGPGLPTGGSLIEYEIYTPNLKGTTIPISGLVQLVSQTQSAVTSTTIIPASGLRDNSRPIVWGWVGLEVADEVIFDSRHTCPSGSKGEYSAPPNSHFVTYNTNTWVPTGYANWDVLEIATNTTITFLELRGAGEDSVTVLEGTGSSAGVSSADSILFGTGRILGNSEGQSSSSGILSALGNLTGSSEGISTSSSSEFISELGNLVGSSAGIGDSSSLLQATGYLTGSSLGQSTASSNEFLGETGNLTGSSSGIGDTSSIISSLGYLTGNSASVSTATSISNGVGYVTGSSPSLSEATSSEFVGEGGYLTGESAGVSSVSGILQGIGYLLGSSEGVSSSSGSFEINLTGFSAGLSTANSLINGTGYLTGRAFAGNYSNFEPEGEALISAIGNLIGSSQGVSSVNSNDVGIGNLTGGSQGQSTVNSSEFANESGSLTGSSEGISSGSSNIEGDGYLTGNSEGVSTVSAVIAGVFYLVGSSAGESSSSSSEFISEAGNLTGSSQGIGSASAEIDYEVNLTGSSEGVGAAYSLISGVGYLTGSSQGVSSASAEFTGTGTYNVTYWDTEIEWIPRWMDAVYDTSSILRIIYTELTRNTGRTLNFFKNYYLPNYFGFESNPRLIYYTSFVVNEGVPNVEFTPRTLNSNATTNNIRISRTYKELLFEENPCVYFSETGSIFNNLASVSYETQSTSGLIDLNNIFATDPPIKDTHLIVTDTSGNKYRLDRLNLVDNRYLPVKRDSVFTLTYQSSSLHHQILNNSTVLYINDESVKLTPQQITNLWDEIGVLKGLTRFNGETNITLKKRVQQTTRSMSPETYISAALSLANNSWWDPRTYSVTTSSLNGTTVDVWNYQKIKSIEELTVIKNSNKIYTLKQPTSKVYLFYNDNPVQTENYSTSGSVITLLRPHLIDSNSSSFKLFYRSDNYIPTVTQNSSGINNVLHITNNGLNEPALLLTATGVQIDCIENKDLTFIWDSGEPINYTSGSSFV